MADASVEHEQLIRDKEDLNISISSPEKSLNVTEKTTLLDMSLSVCENTDEAELKPDQDTAGHHENEEKTDHGLCHDAKNSTAEAEVLKSSDNTVDGKCAEKIVKKELKKSLSYGSPSSESKNSKPKVKHSFSVNPDAINAARMSKSLNIAVFLKEGTGRLLSLENGRQTTAGEIKHMMVDNLALPAQAEEIFAIWLISPLLELQLKSQHIPFRLRRQWKDLLRRFSTAKEDEIEKDEPVMVFQRNSFLSVTEEKTLTDERIIRRLFEEAKLNILKGRYRVTNADAEILGGYLARIEHGKFDEEVHKLGFFKKSLQDYLPASAIRKQWIPKSIFTRLTSVEQNLLNQYRLASERADDPKKFYRLFLEHCWRLPFYGCAFFRGQVEQQTHDMYPWKHHTMNVSIGIGREGITIFRDNKTEILINLSYDELSWDYSQAANDDDNGVDSFCIEYDTVASDGRHVAKQLQIFSPQIYCSIDRSTEDYRSSVQDLMRYVRILSSHISIQLERSANVLPLFILQKAAMMDALVDSCVAEMNRLKIPKSPVSPVFTDEGKPLADQGPPNLKREPKRNFSLSNPFKLK